jgi:hypothetical protein
MCCGAPDLAEIMLARSQRSEIRLDGSAKVVTAPLGALLGSIGALESGLESRDAAGRAA